MKKIFLALLLATTFSTGNAQQQKFKYDDYFYYRNHQYLQTPSILLTGATLKIASGDTAAAITLIKQAAQKDMYDTGYITGRSAIKFITRTKHWIEIKKTIQDNRDRFSNPATMQIVTSDIDKFWQLYDKINDKQADDIFMQRYIVAGSQGLRTFFEVRMNLRATNLISTVRGYNKYYESIKPVSLALKNYTPQIIAAAKKLKALYDDAIFPPTTFTIANFNAFGTADGGGGQLIGSEFLCNPATADTTQLSNWEKSNLTDTSKILGIVIQRIDTY